MAGQQIVLFDLASKSPCKSWSLNPWKSRFALNYKGLDYKTEWMEYPDLKPRFREHFPADTQAYTSPTVIMPDGTWIMDSWNIAQALEEKYPEPSMHLDSPVLPKLLDLMPKIMGALRGVYIPLVVERLLNDVNHSYWHETREKVVGMPLNQLAKEHGGEVAYKNAEQHLKEVTILLNENSEGPFFMGKTVSYVDFVWAGLLIFYRRVGKDEFESVLKATGDADAHLKLLEAVKPWSERDDH